METATPSLDYILSQPEPNADGLWPTKFGDWHYVPSVSPALFAKILASYAPAFHDSHTVADLIALIARGAVFVRPEAGWFVLDGWTTNGAVEIHGAKWNPTADLRTPETDSLFDALLENFVLAALVAQVPEHFEGANALVEDWGFKHCGIIPLRLSFGGVPRSLNVYARWRK